MKNLKDLKEEILANTFQPLYIFYGEDNGIRQHYVHEIAKRTGLKINMIMNFDDFLKAKSGGKSLFSRKSLYVYYYIKPSNTKTKKEDKKVETDILKFDAESLYKLIKRLEQDILIILIDKNPNDTSEFNPVLWTSGDKYLTYFLLANENICCQFVDSEVSLDINNKKSLVFNCGNNYNKILLDCDKIKHYAEANNISQNEAYNILENRNQLFITFPDFHSDKLTNDILQGHKQYYWYWYQTIKANFLEDFWISLANIMNDFIIAYMIKHYGSYQGGGL